MTINFKFSKGTSRAKITKKGPPKYLNQIKLASPKTKWMVFTICWCYMWQSWIYPLIISGNLSFLDRSWIDRNNFKKNFSPEKCEEAPELLQLMEILVQKVAKMGNIQDLDTTNLSQIFITSKRLKTRMKVVSKNMKAFHMFHLPILAEYGLVSLVADHKHIGKWQSDKERKCFGICAVITDNSGRKRRFILDYMWVLSIGSIHLSRCQY